MSASTDAIGLHAAGAETQTLATPKSQVDPEQIANKTAFLKLLVAQIRHQNPLNPADGVQFLTQLAQFSELEQMMGMREELAALRRDLETRSAPTAEGNSAVAGT